MLAEVLKRVRGNLTLDDLATRMGVHKNTLGNYERGERQPDIDFLAAFAVVTGASLAELLALRIQAGSKGAVVLPAEWVCQSLGVPSVVVESPGVREPEAGYAKGGGELFSVPVLGERGGEAMIALRRDWLEAMGLEPARLAAVVADDDAMQPAIRVGSVVLADTRGAGRVADGIYVIECDGRLLVRRIQTDMAQGVYLHCDNPAYRELHFQAEAMPDIRIVGPAVWAGGRL